MAAYISSLSITRGRSIGTPCSAAWRISGADGCTPVGSIYRSQVPHTSVQVWEKPTSFHRAARLFSNLPSSWGIEVRRGWLIDTYGINVGIGVSIENILRTPTAVPAALLWVGGGS